jgi:hypothetical protein
MFNFGWLELAMEQEMARRHQFDPALLELIEELKQQRKHSSLRSRVAGVFVGFALKLDPEVFAEPAPQPHLILEAANVRG